MSIKFGKCNINIPYKKAYLGKKLIYKKSEYIEFNSLITPTNWSEVTKGTKYVGTNSYGEWTIEASNYSSGYEAYKAFDNKTNTSLCQTTISAKARTLILNLPISISINPKSIYFKYRTYGSGSKLMGYNIKTSEWEILLEFERKSSDTIIEQNLSLSNYYSAFKIEITRFSSSATLAYTYEFQIKSGTIRKEM